MPGKIAGTVVSITEAGNLVTDIAADRLKGIPKLDAVTVRCDEHETLGIFTADHNEPEMTLLALIGPNDTLELEIVGDSAKIMLGIQVGENVEVRW